MLGDSEGGGGLVRRFRESETEVLLGDSDVVEGRSCWENLRETAAEVFLGDSEGVGERSCFRL